MCARSADVEAGAKGILLSNSAFQKTSQVFIKLTLPVVFFSLLSSSLSSTRARALLDAAISVLFTFKIDRLARARGTNEIQFPPKNNFPNLNRPKKS